MFWLRRKRSQVPEEEEEDGGKRPYVKKPLNAFMVYMKEQRPFIDLELKAKGNGVVNMYLAQKVGQHTSHFLSAASCFNLNVCRLSGRG